MEYNTDRWVMLKFTNSNYSVYKILAGFIGGYDQGQSWKLNSGCTRVEEDGDYYLFHGYSGSIYRCHKNAYGYTSMTIAILNSFEKKIARGNCQPIEVLSSETNFMEINYNESDNAQPTEH